MIEMARLATEKLFDNGVNCDAIDLLILVTQSPAYPLPKCLDALLDRSAINLNDIAMFIFHQASKLVIKNLIRKLEWNDQKVFVNYKNVGNTVFAFIPIALKQAFDEKKLRKGDKVMSVGFGVDLSWGSCLMTCDIAA